MRSSSSMRRRPANVGSTAGSSSPSNDPCRCRERAFADMCSMFAPRSADGQGGQTAAVPESVDDPAIPASPTTSSSPIPAAQRRHERDELFVVEGVTAIERLLESGHRVRSVLVTPQALARLAGRLDALDAPVYVAPQSVLAATVGFDLHRGAVAAADRRPLPVDRRGDRRHPAHRRARGAQRSGEPRRHRPLGARPRASRRWSSTRRASTPTTGAPCGSAMGEVLLLPVARAAAWPDDLDTVPRRRVRDVGAHAGPAGRADLVARGAGPGRPRARRRGPGLSPAALAAADRRVRIPIHAGVDSLNVGHAAAVAFAAIGRPV